MFTADAQRKQRRRIKQLITRQSKYNKKVLSLAIQGFEKKEKNSFNLAKKDIFYLKGGGGWSRLLKNSPVLFTLFVYIIIFGQLSCLYGGHF